LIGYTPALPDGQLFDPDDTGTPCPGGGVMYKNTGSTQEWADRWASATATGRSTGRGEERGVRALTGQGLSAL
jgi:hypothetical protein